MSTVDFDAVYAELSDDYGEDVAGRALDRYGSDFAAVERNGSLLGTVQHVLDDYADDRFRDAAVAAAERYLDDLAVMDPENGPHPESEAEHAAAMERTWAYEDRLDMTQQEWTADVARSWLRGVGAAADRTALFDDLFEALPLSPLAIDFRRAAEDTALGMPDALSADMDLDAERERQELRYAVVTALHPSYEG